MAKCNNCNFEIYMGKNICPSCGYIQDQSLELLKNAELKRKNRMLKLMCFGIVLFFFTKFLIGIPSVSSRDNTYIDVTENPIQKMNSKIPAIYIKKARGSFYLQPMADYQISAVLVSKENYKYDTSAVLSPVDLLLIWGDVTKKKFKDNLEFSQYGRFGSCTSKSLDEEDFSYIGSHMSNNHIIPSSNNIKKAINKLKTNDKLVITGYLVNVSGEYKSKNFLWETSLSRTDNGAGACEVIYVTKVKIGNKVYQ